MRVSHFNVYDSASDSEQIYGEQLGFVSSLMAGSTTHAGALQPYFNQVLIPAIFHENIKIYFGEDGAAVGYVIWAFLIPEVAQRVLEGGVAYLHESEWNEGDALWVVDFLATSGSLKSILRDLRDVTFAEKRTVHYVRTKNQKILKKQISRNETLSFFR